MSLVWAMDPFEEDLRPSPKVLHQLKTLVGNSLERVTPVFVCGVDTESLTEEERRLEGYVRSFIKEPTAKPRVLHTGTPTKRDWIATLVNFAQESGAEMVVLSSHGRDGLSRLVFGSFAATLLEHSPLPVLFLPRESEEGESLVESRKALFTTDFSEASKKAFGRFLASFHQRFEQVTLFHAVSFSEAATGVMGMAGVPAAYPDNYIKEQIQWAERQAKAWIQEFGPQAGFCRLQSLVDEGALMNSSIAIQKFLEKNPVSLVGMASHSGSVSKFFLGSVTQDLVVARKWPIWACGPQF